MILNIIFALKRCLCYELIPSNQHSTRCREKHIRVEMRFEHFPMYAVTQKEKQKP